MEELQVPLDPSHMFDKPDVGESDDKESKLQWVEKKYRGSSGSSKVCITVLFQQISCAMKKVVHYFIQQNVSKETRIACCSLDHIAPWPWRDLAPMQKPQEKIRTSCTNNAGRQNQRD